MSELNHMSEHEPLHTSEMLNKAFTVPIKAFHEKRMQQEAVEENNYSLHIEKVSVPPFVESDQDFLKQFPDIYNQNTENMECLKAFDGMNLVAPIGEYGEDWARKLINATHTLRSEALEAHRSTNVISETDVLKDQRKQILETASHGNQSIDELGTFSPFDEGVQSVLFAAGLLTAKKLNGYEDPQQLLQALTDQKIFSKLALVIPSTIAARLGNRGWTFTDPLIEEENQKLSVSKKVINHFMQQRDNYKQLSTSASQLLDKKGCPVARMLPENDSSGVDITAQLLTHAVAQQNKKSGE